MPKPPPASDPLRSALSEILAALKEDEDKGREAGKKAAKSKELKEALAPLNLGRQPVSRPENLMRRCLELPEDHPLHLAADALLSAGEMTTPCGSP